MSSNLVEYYLMVFIKLLDIKEAAYSALYLLKELLWGKNKVSCAKNYCRQALLSVLDLSKQPEMSQLISEILRLIEDTKPLETDSSILQSIKNNLYSESSE